MFEGALESSHAQQGLAVDVPAVWNTGLAFTHPTGAPVHFPDYLLFFYFL